MCNNEGNALGNGSQQRVPCRPNGPAVRRKNRWPVGPMHALEGYPFPRALPSLLHTSGGVMKIQGQAMSTPIYGRFRRRRY